MNGGKFEHLLRPIEFGGIKLKNRMVMAPMATNLATEDGFVTERLRPITRSGRRAESG